MAPKQDSDNAEPPQDLEPEGEVRGGARSAPNGGPIVTDGVNRIASGAEKDGGPIVTD